MSIKPIDFNVILPKTQELNSNRLIENSKHKNIVESNFIQREKVTNQNRKKVLDTEKTNQGKINKDNESKNQYKQGKQKRKEVKENPSKTKRTSFSGHKIDIQI